MKEKVGKIQNKYLFLDLDGTLLNVYNRYYKIYMDIMKRHGFSFLEMKDYIFAIRNKNSQRDIIKRTVNFSSKNEEDAFTSEFVKERMARMEQYSYLHLDTLQSGVIEFLNKAKNAFGYRIVLISLRKNQLNFERQLSSLGLIKYVDHSFTYSTIEKDSSKMDNYKIKQRVIQKIRNKKNFIGIIIGDSEADIKAGKMESLFTVATTNGLRSKSYLETLEPNLIINDLTELIRIL